MERDGEISQQSIWNQLIDHCVNTYYKTILDRTINRYDNIPTFHRLHQLGILYGGGKNNKIKNVFWIFMSLNINFVIIGTFLAQKSLRKSIPLLNCANFCGCRNFAPCMASLTWPLYCLSPLANTNILMVVSWKKQTKCFIVWI